MNELITTFNSQLAGESQALVNARDLHEFLGSKQDFSNWIKNRIEQCRFKEGEDYSINLLNRSFGIGKPKTEYHISLRMAEHLGMMENSERGFEIRDYFSRVEKQARQHIPAFLRRGADNLGSPAEHQLAVMRSVLLDAKPMWAKLKRYFEANLTQGEMRQLTGMGDNALRENLRHMTLAGLINYTTNPKLSAAGSKGNAKRLVAKNVH